MTRSRTVRRLAATAAVSLLSLLAACSTDTDTDTDTGSESHASDGERTTAGALGQLDIPADANADLKKQYLLKNAIAACMKRQGFAYTPVPPEDPAASCSGKSGSGSEEPGGGSGKSGSGSEDGSGTGGDAAELQLKSAQQQLDAANAALSAFQAGYGTKVPAGEVVFLPKLPARLDKVSVKTGDTPSGPVATVTSSKVVVRAVVPADDAELLHKGMRARVETTDGTEADGEVVALGDDVPKDAPADTDKQQGTSDGGSGDSSAPVPVQISVSAGKLAEKAAESAKVTIEVGSSEGKVLTVPVAALHTSADRKARVQVVRGGEVVDVPVEAGLSAGGQVEVTPSSGAALKSGDQVVVGR
ncbi:hypothetical protein ACIF9R_21375 [Streptomyces sp. NPDC086080]|uniref:hypothetical protein n=1 Tax=Streptomyces sp. NPDC086080 TaxID=3365748 RepID=UPI0037D25260